MNVLVVAGETGKENDEGPNLGSSCLSSCMTDVTKKPQVCVPATRFESSFTNGLQDQIFGYAGITNF